VKKITFNAAILKTEEMAGENKMFSAGFGSVE
jgi:hypothetical protein